MGILAQLVIVKASMLSCPNIKKLMLMIYKKVSVDPPIDVCRLDVPAKIILLERFLVIFRFFQSTSNLTQHKGKERVVCHTVKPALKVEEDLYCHSHYCSCGFQVAKSEPKSEVHQQHSAGLNEKNRNRQIQDEPISDLLSRNSFMLPREK